MSTEEARPFLEDGSETKSFRGSVGMGPLGRTLTVSLLANGVLLVVCLFFGIALVSIPNCNPRHRASGLITSTGKMVEPYCESTIYLRS